ncbi:hypothetical protein D521_1459 [beta proteobacterium CB]|nr:hypothetical protein D521_1459 [beta proteobacterium CB]
MAVQGGMTLAHAVKKPKLRQEMIRKKRFKGPLEGLKMAVFIAVFL